MPSNQSNINIGVKYNVDQASVNAVKKSLQDLQNIKPSNFSGSKQELQQVKQLASQVQIALTKAFNVNLNSLNVQKFSQELGLSAQKVNQIYTTFAKAGAQGKVAFSQMTSSILTTNMQLKQTKGLISQMGETMANTVKWGIASSVMNSFANSVRSAFDYVKALDSSLTDIRIVTKQSSDQMANFAVQANNAAQSLGRSTMDYTKAALTFYQQGLGQADVQARTEATLKAQNITGAGDQMADYLTAVWNGYKVANEEAQLYVDKLAAVADSSASNMSQLAIAMSKVASSANLLGVPVDKLNAQIATIVATTRQAPESVGNALKTIYSRINDIATGADDAQISLGNYSKKMLDVGISVLDANGNLRDTGDVIDEIGGKWQTLSHEQQIYLARTMAGQRQYNNLLALFENWGKYSDLVNVSMQAQGTTAQKNSIYMESLAAKMEQLGAAGERLKSAFIDENDLKGLVSFGTGAVNLFANLIESIGGGKNAILLLGSVFTQVFSGTIAKQINNVVTHFQNLKQNAEILKRDIASTQLFGKSQGYEDGTIKAMIDAKKEIQSYYNLMSAEQVNTYNDMVKQVGIAQQQVLIYKEKVEQAEKFNNAIEAVAAANNIPFFDQLDTASEKINEVTDSLSEITGSGFSQMSDVDFFEKIVQSVYEMKAALGEGFFDKEQFSQFDQLVVSLYDKFAEGPEKVLENRDAFIELLNIIRQFESQANQGIGSFTQMDQLTQSLQRAQAELQLASQKVKEFQTSMQQFSNIKGIVDLTSAFGRLASGVNSLSNLKNIWSNENLSNSQKLLQTMTNLGMTVPMLVTAYKKLQQTSLALSNSMINQTAINQAAAKVEKAQLAIKEAKKKVVEAQKAVNEGAAGSEAALAAAEQSEAVATNQATVAQQELNVAMTANPIGALIKGITIAIVALTAFIKLIDHFHMSVKEAGQAIDTFNEKQSQSFQNQQSFATQTAQLKDLQKEYDELAKKADANNFDANIESLTQAERTRYNQIKNLIVQYNEDALAGYNSQGQAILLNNSYLQQTIELLKEKRQLEIDETYGGKQFKQAQKGKNVEYRDAQSGVESAEQAIDTIKADRGSGYSWNERFAALDTGANGIRQLAYDTDLFEEQLEKIKQIQKDGVQNFDKHKDQLNGIIDQIQTIAQNNNQALITAQIDNIRDSIEQIGEYSQQLQRAEGDLAIAQDKLAEKAKLDPKYVLGVLQTSDNNQEYNALAEEYGESLINGIITNLVEGMTRDKNFDETAAAQQIRETILKPLQNINITDKDLSAITQQAVKINEFDWDAVGWIPESYGKAVANTIEKVTSENIKLQQLAKQNPQVYEALINSLFGIENIDFNLEDNGQIVVKKVETQFDKLREQVQSKAKQLDPIDLDIPWNIMSNQARQNFSKSLEDWISTADINSLKNFDEILQIANIDVNNVKDSLDDAAIKVRNLSSAMSAADSLDLLNQKLSGQNLNEDQLASMYSGLQQLKQVYPQIAGSVQILNKEWLEGTALYQRAVEDVKNAVFDSFSRIGQYTEEVMGKISSLIVTTEDLQNAITQNKEILNTDGGQEWYAEQLQKIASNYQSCTDELNRYLAARKQGNTIQEEAARYDLQLAARSEQNSRAYDIEAQRISQVAKQFAEYAREGREGYQGLEDNAQLAADAATRYLRLNDAVADLTDNFDKYKEVLEEARDYGTESVRASEDMNSTFEGLKESVADLLDTSSQLLGDDWIVENMDNILQAAQGNEEALRNLQQSAGEEILLNMGVDMSSLDLANDDILSWIESLPDGQIDMTLDDSQYLNQLVWAMQAAGHGQQEIEDALSGLNLDVDLGPYEAGLNDAVDAAYKASDNIVSNLGFDAQAKSDTKTDTDTSQLMGYEATPIPMSAPVSIPQFQQVVTPFGVIPIMSGTQTANIEYSGVSISPQVDPIDTTKQTTTTALMVKNARKKSGGNIAHSNKKSTGSGGGKGGGGKKGGSKGKTPAKASIAKTSNAKIQPKKQQAKYDPYQQINKELKQQDKILDDLQNKEKHLSGKDRLKNLMDQTAQLQKQAELYEARVAINKGQGGEKGTSAWYRDRLKEAFGDNFQLDKNGQLANQNLLRQLAVDKYDAGAKQVTDAYKSIEQDYNTWIENVWNKAANKDEQEKLQAEKDKWDEKLKQAKDTADQGLKDVEEIYKDTLSYIDGYNQQIEQAEKDNEAARKARQQARDTYIEIAQFKVKLSLDSGDFERDYLDFEKKFIKKIKDDDFVGQATYGFKQLKSYFDSGEVQNTAMEIAQLQDQIAKMQNGEDGYYYGDRLDQARERLKELVQQQEKQLAQVQELADAIKDDYLDSLDNAKDKMDDLISQYERVGDLIDHNVKLTQLLYGDKAYASMDKYYELQKANNERELVTLRSQQDYWQKMMDNALAVGDQDTYEKAKASWDDVTDSMNSKLEEMIENLSDQWENRVDGIIEKMNNALTNGRGLDYVDQEWDAINMWDDTFLDPVESRMGINEVQSLYQQAIDGLTGSPAQQQKMNKLMSDQLKLLREKDNLTQYDLDRAKAALEVEKARLALEQARDNKNKMRLRRDSQGNYTYQYVADEQKLNDLQKSLADAQANLYNMDKEHYKETLDDLYDTYKDYIDKMKDLTAEYNATQDEEERKRIQDRMNLLQESYGKYYDAVTSDSKFNKQQYLAFSTAMGMGLDPGQYTNEQLMTLVDTVVPQASSEIDKLRQTVAGKGGLLAATKDGVAEIAQATKEYDIQVQEMLAAAGTSLDTIKNVTDDLGNALDGTIIKTQSLLGTYSDMVDKSVQAVKGVKDVLDMTNTFLEGNITPGLVNQIMQGYNTVQTGLYGDYVHPIDATTGEDLTLISNRKDATLGNGYVGYGLEGQIKNTLPIDLTNQSVVADYINYLNDMGAFTQLYQGNLSEEERTNLLNEIDNARLQYSQLLENQNNIIANITQSVIDSTNTLALGLEDQFNEALKNISSFTQYANEIETLNQNVNIQASFPNVINHVEIEQAFNELVNIAAQNAARNGG